MCPIPLYSLSLLLTMLSLFHKTNILFSSRSPGKDALSPFLSLKEVTSQACSVFPTSHMVCLQKILCRFLQNHTVLKLQERGLHQKWINFQRINIMSENKWDNSALKELIKVLKDTFSPKPCCPVFLCSFIWFLLLLLVLVTYRCLWTALGWVSLYRVPTVP